MEYVLIWIVFAFITAGVAYSRGVKYLLPWILGGLFFGPFALLVAIFMTGRRCPECQSRINKTATRCPKCHVGLAVAARAKPA